MDVKEIQNLSEYVYEICEINNGKRCNGATHNEVLLFRGQADTKYELIPYLGRGRRFSCDISIFNEERNLIEMAKYKMPDIFRNDLLPLELLALLQHHGIPTRLLDITENALVALYFECNSKFESDGEVIVFKDNELDVTNYPIVNAIADSYRFARGTVCTLDLFYGDAINQPHFVEQKQTHEICHETKEQGGQWVAECCEKIFFVYAPIRTLRQQVQRGRYILFPNKIEPYGNGGKKAFTTVIDPIPKNHECIARRFHIPASLKKQILIDLKAFGISEEILFCDSTDMVCKGILNTITGYLKGKPI